jgi:hypothetical protein
LKKDFQLHIKTTKSKFFHIKYKIFVTFLGFHDSWLHFRPHKVYFFELSIKFLIGHTIYKKIHDSQIPFLGSNGFRLDFRPHKVNFFELSVKFYIKSSPKTLKLVKISREREKGAIIRMGATPRNLFPKSKNQ